MVMTLLLMFMAESVGDPCNTQYIEHGLSETTRDACLLVEKAKGTQTRPHSGVTTITPTYLALPNDRC
jgi:hypothetical protein